MPADRDPVTDRQQPAGLALASHHRPGDQGGHRRPVSPFDREVPGREGTGRAGPRRSGPGSRRGQDHAPYPGELGLPGSAHGRGPGPGHRLHRGGLAVAGGREPGRAVGIAAAGRVELHAGGPRAATGHGLDDAAPGLRERSRRDPRAARQRPPGRAHPDRLLHRRDVPAGSRDGPCRRSCASTAGDAGAAEAPVPASTASPTSPRCSPSPAPPCTAHSNAAGPIRRADSRPADQHVGFLMPPQPAPEPTASTDTSPTRRKAGLDSCAGRGRGPPRLGPVTPGLPDSPDQAKPRRTT